MPFVPASGSVFASTMAQSAAWAPVIQAFPPSRT